MRRGPGIKAEPSHELSLVEMVSSDAFFSCMHLSSMFLVLFVVSGMAMIRGYDVIGKIV